MNRVLHSGMYFVVFPIAYALAVAAGRATRLAGGEVALVWPAAAVGIIWLLATRRLGVRERAAHVVLLGAVAFATNVATGAAVPLSAWFILVNVALPVVTVEVLTSRRDEIALRDPADLARLVIAVTAGTCCAAVLATSYFVVVMNGELWKTFALFTIRNGATALLGVALWLRWHDITWKFPRFSVMAVAEALVVGAGVVAVLIWTFWLVTGVPMAFVALVPAMLLTLRYSTTVSTVFLTAAGSWIIFATLRDKGSLIVPDVQVRALLAQAMVGSLTLIVLTLSLYRDSRARLIAQLEQARDEADRDSDLLSGVLDSIHDSVVLVDAAGDVVLQNARAAQSGIVDDVVAVSRPKDTGNGPDMTMRHGPRDVTVSAAEPRIIELNRGPLARQASLNVLAFHDVTEERRTAQALREARDLFAGVLDAASEQAIIGTDPQGRITVFNRGAQRLLGWSEEEMLGRTPMDFHFLPEVCARAEELAVEPGFDVFVHNVTPEAAEVREWTYVRRDGTRAAVSLAVSQMSDEDGNCKGYIGVAMDITEQQAAKQALADSEERFRLAFDTAPMGMFMFTVTSPRAGSITRCNQAMADLLGRSTSELLGMTVPELAGDVSSDAAVHLNQSMSLVLGQPFEAEMRFTRADGVAAWGAVTASLVAPGGSDPYGICLVEDITSRKDAEAELKHLATHDPLTGLANQLLFTERVERALAEVDGGGSARVGLIYLDLDGFKAVNDTWGHAEGDGVLAEVARRIQSRIGITDTAARLGGDEFAVLCPDVSGTVAGTERLHSLAERIREEVCHPVKLSVGRTYDGLTVSAGVVTSRPGCTAMTLLRRADKTMYRAKRAGKNRVTSMEESPS